MLAANIAPTRRRPRFTLMLHGRSGVLVAELGPGDTKIIGRASPADIVVEDASLSRRHARVCWHDDGVLVEDLGSKNGTAYAGAAVERVVARPGAKVCLGNVAMLVRHAQDIERRGFEDFDRFLGRIDDELVRARTLSRPLSLLMLRALPSDAQLTDTWSLRVRAQLRPIDTIALYAPGTLLILLPELAAAETHFVARALVDSHARNHVNHVDAPPLVCGVATLQHAAHTSYALLEAASGAARAASAEAPVVLADARTAELARGEPCVVDAAMRELYRVARRVASHAAPVLILGETGTGKELVARYTHASGTRRDKPFRAINCGAIPANLVESVLFGHERGAFTGANDMRKGVFEDADGGTLFLDEVGELPWAAQAALLRVLETKQLTRVGGTRHIDIDVRIVSATHCDLEAMVAGKSFRADLFHRLNLITLHVPPLRERPDEIDVLAQRFLRSPDIAAHTRASNLSSAALASLRAYAWPGNVRELRNVIERAALLCDGATLDCADLPERVRTSTRATPELQSEDPEAAPGRFAALVRSYEVQLIRDALQTAGGNQTKAAELLGMPLRTLVYKIRSYRLRRGADEAVAI